MGLAAAAGDRIYHDYPAKIRTSGAARDRFSGTVNGDKGGLVTLRQFRLPHFPFLPAVKLCARLFHLPPNLPVFYILSISWLCSAGTLE